jgi:hypothetical protein
MALGKNSSEKGTIVGYSGEVNDGQRRRARYTHLLLNPLTSGFAKIIEVIVGNFEGIITKPFVIG